MAVDQYGIRFTTERLSIELMKKRRSTKNCYITIFGKIFKNVYLCHKAE